LEACKIETASLTNFIHFKSDLTAEQKYLARSIERYSTKLMPGCDKIYALDKGVRKDGTEFSEDCATSECKRARIVGSAKCPLHTDKHPCAAHFWCHSNATHGGSLCQKHEGMCGDCATRGCHSMPLLPGSLCRSCAQEAFVRSGGYLR